MVEREKELALLADLFNGCLDARGGIAVIDGPAAAGKTTLLRSFAEHIAGSGALFLHATGTYAERATPLGVMRQLFRRTESLASTDPQVVRLLDDDMFAAVFDEEKGGGESIAWVAPPVQQELCAMLFRAAELRPVVIAVDDAHHVDETSLRCLLYLAHRLKSDQIMLVLAERTALPPEYSLFLAELLSRPYCRRVRLRLLSPRGQVRLLTERFSRSEATRLVSSCHAVTGGNPLLVRALLEDSRVPGRDADDLVVGTTFTQAVLGIVHRGGPAMSGVARALAVLREPASSAVLGRMLGLGADHVAYVLEAMGMAGLLDAGAFRHPMVRAAILDSIPADERTAMHGLAARLLHEDGAPQAVVAAHLVEAREAGPPWTAAVLEETAQQAIADDEPHIALACLRLAHRTCADPRERAHITDALAQVEWRIDPAFVGRRLPDLICAAGEGLLTGRQTLALAYHLMWSGRAKEAMDIFRRQTTTTLPAAGEPARELAAMRLLLASACPGIREDVPAGPATPDGPDGPDGPDRTGRTGRTPGSLVAPGDEDLVSAAASGPLRVATALSSVISGDAGGEPIVVAEQILAGTRLTQRSLEHIIAAVGVFVYADRPARAAHWCDAFLEEAAVRRAPTWHAMLVAARAVISVRQGNMRIAEDHARTALSRISPSGWGVAVGLPISVMVLATTAMGRFEDAATHLDIPVPDAMFETLCGLHYLHASGRYHLATGSPRAALTDFLTCGDLMARWGCDTPGLVPWRTEAAQALLTLGERGEATRLVREQLALLDPAPSRTRGACLRVQAMAAGSRGRPALLNEAVQVLEHSEDRYELALALAQLSMAQHAVGEHGKARSAAHAAQRLGRGCGVRPLGTAPLGTVTEASGPETRSSPAPAGRLTEAELKVAELAARGHANRQIARTLLITVSTVEQHLTRVYRKLQVNHRSELQPLLRPEPTNSHADGERRPSNWIERSNGGQFPVS